MFSVIITSCVCIWQFYELEQISNDDLFCFLRIKSNVCFREECCNPMLPKGCLISFGQPHFCLIYLYFNRRSFCYSRAPFFFNPTKSVITVLFILINKQADFSSLVLDLPLPARAYWSCPKNLLKANVFIFFYLRFRRNYFYTFSIQYFASMEKTSIFATLLAKFLSSSVG